MAPAFLWLFQARRAELLQRFQGFLEPMQVYQVQRSLFGIGSGGAAGKGVGLGMEPAFYLPEAYNDFIFSVFAEETGFLGVVVLLGLFTLFLQSGWRIVRRCPDPALRILGLGILVNIILQAVINIAVATASAPTKGIGLPFLSYGSSGLTMVLLQVGILLALSRLPSKELREAGALDG